MQKEQLNHFISTYRDGLLQDTLPFWLEHSVDKQCGGYLTFLDHDGTIVSTDKPMWITGRFVWLLSRLYNAVEKNDYWLQTARHGIDFLRKYAFDADGRMFYSVTRDGSPLRKRRYLFTEAFGVIGFAEYARASGDAASMDKARELFQLMLRFHSVPGLLEPKTNPQSRPLKSHAMPMILLATANVLQQACNDAIYEKVKEASIREIREDFVKPELKALLENVGPQGEFLDEPDGRQINPGHAIETAWFLMEAAISRKDSEDLIHQACQILDWSLDWGWDTQYGGLYYFRDCKEMPCPQYEHDMKLWWPHTEAIYATLLAYHLTSNDRYLAWHQKIHDWAYAHFPDKYFGEWFGYLHRDGTLASTLKGNMWKGPFHLPRMQFNCWKLLEKMMSQ